MRSVLFAAALLAWVGSARAAVSTGVNQTFGSNNYYGAKLWADVGGAFHVRPSLSFYRSDSSSGTFKSLSARLAYDGERWGVAATFGGSPKTAGYSSRFFGFDGSYTWDLPWRDPDDAAARADASLGLTLTRHTDDLESGGGAGRQALRRRLSSVSIGQTEVFAGAGLLYWDFDASLQVSKHSYDRDLEKISARAGPIVALAGLNSMVQGFPNYSVTTRLDWRRFKLFSPYASFTYTDFTVGAPQAKTYGLGASVDVKLARADLSYERYLPGGGQQNLDYFNLGLRFKF